MVSATSSTPIKTKLNYYREPSQGGTDFFLAGTAGEKRRKHAPADVLIHDMRGHEVDFTLDKQGFQVVKSVTAEKDFDDDEKIKTIYYPECAEIIKTATGATHVHPMSHIVRRQSFETALAAEKNFSDTDRSTGPSYASFVHVDQSYTGAEQRIMEGLPEYAERIKQHRWAIINVWRPIDRPVTRNALCMADARSIPETSLRTVMAVFPKSDQVDGKMKDPYSNRPNFGTWAVTPPNDANEHKWYYQSEMTPDEALLLKIFDSKRSGGVARRSPHTSFTSDRDYGLERHSLECRCLVLWEDQPIEA